MFAVDLCFPFSCSCCCCCCYLLVLLPAPAAAAAVVAASLLLLLSPLSAVKERESACSQFLVFLLAVAIAAVLCGIYLFELPAVHVGKGQEEEGEMESEAELTAQAGKNVNFWLVMLM